MEEQVRMRQPEQFLLRGKVSAIAEGEISLLLITLPSILQLSSQYSSQIPRSSTFNLPYILILP